VPAFSSVLVDTSSFVVSHLVKICCREKPILVLSYRIKKLKVSGYLSFLHDGFSNMPVSYSVKYIRGLELLFNSFLATIVSFVSLLASIVVFLCVSLVPNPVSRDDSLSIAMRS
jgi:hypothetical protein